MSVMSDLHAEVQMMLEQGHAPWAIAQTLEIPVSWVYEVFEQMTEDMPEAAEMSEEEIDKMAEYYGYGIEANCEFD